MSTIGSFIYMLDQLIELFGRDYEVFFLEGGVSLGVNFVVSKSHGIS